MTERRPFIAGNWKMHKTTGEARALAEALVENLKDCPHKVMVAPPFTALSAVREVLKGSPILLGAQNMCSVREGAHTGEISVLMLKDLDVSVVILGHSERRLIYGETDRLINEKVRLALEEGMEVILCVGETLEQREAGKAEQVVEEQVKRGLDGVAPEDLSRVTIAYEPVWAIGTGRTARPEDADAMHRHIRRTVASLHGTDAAEALIIQYGGSVKPSNIKALMAMENIDGALVGGASLSAENFLPIVNFHLE
ncbi:triosephosphate isomerase [Spirochaeta thermophila DSM 6578]|uniref:Triosephosphate isomerase n=1 Tax=Winmispira thermophila (strain ATCC 700085 / DSM 6578 / Z-1203) TaxID=869211 RepID=G0GCY6_WINT7|nr:triose-phosphate isomerase [Spirochaeta thermophila]AEJ61278.1 triosephosphate isomerase [Spirochaeta thermophila DSM 6578]